ncbi:hypothetical protein L6452_05222 [Arctium lappa]|uniref:Uncharacterized protein n=1 Tax=Arctium lappa TaxID=4217 RepID=A0ACB9EFH5_ARCLA|nr:hypothetical protein L6452_05222 [Arctium lappa]
MDVGGATSEKLEHGGSHGGVKVCIERDNGKVVEGDGGEGGGDVADIGGGGAGVEGGDEGEDDDCEGRVVVEDEFSELHHGYQGAPSPVMDTELQCPFLCIIDKQRHIQHVTVELSKLNNSSKKKG